MTEHSDCAVSK